MGFIAPGTPPLNGGLAYPRNLIYAPQNGTTLTLPRATQTVIFQQLSNSNSFSIDLAAVVPGYVNEYVFIFRTVGTAPTITHPVGTLWRVAAAPTIAAGETWTIVYEIVEVEAGVFQKWAIASKLV